MKMRIKILVSIVVVAALIFSVAGMHAALGSQSGLLGDADANGIVNNTDVIVLRNYLANRSPANFNRENADVNSDDRIDMLDVFGVIRLLTPFDNRTFPIGEIENNIILQGRAVMSTDGGPLDLPIVLMNQTASGIKFRAVLEGDIRFNLTGSNSGFITVLINGTSFAGAAINQQHRVQLPDWARVDLPRGDYTIQILKSNEWAHNSFALRSVTFRGEMLPRPVSDPETKRIEFYGDSITAGYGNLTDRNQSGAGDWIWQDGLQTFATFAANELGAEFAKSVRSGHGVLGDHTHNNDATHHRFFNYAHVGDRIPWDRGAFGADLIVITYGANDHNRELRDGRNFTRFLSSDFEYNYERFENEVRSIIQQMRADNPTVEIWWMFPSYHQSFGGGESPIVTSLRRVANQFSFVRFEILPIGNHGGDWHPSVEDHRAAGTWLANHIRQYFRDREYSGMH